MGQTVDTKAQCQLSVSVTLLATFDDRCTGVSEFHANGFCGFDELLSRVEARIIKRDTQLRPSILLSYSVPFKVGGVANLSSCHVIGCSHRNTGRYIGVNEHCSFPPIYRPIFCNYRLVSLRVGLVPFDTSNFYRPVNRPVYRPPV